MIIIPEFRLVHNTEKGYVAVEPTGLTGDVCCPFCGTILVYRDRKPRRSINIAGERNWYSLRRLFCRMCPKLHTEIPNFIQPYKHYDSAAIQSVLDGSETAGECAADDSTIRRWRKSFKEAKADMAQRLASVYARESDAIVPFAASKLGLAGIQATIDCWLAFVMRLLINNGHKLCTRFAFCPPPATNTMGSARENPTERGGEIDKTSEDTS